MGKLIFRNNGEPGHFTINGRAIVAALSAAVSATVLIGFAMMLWGRAQANGATTQQIRATCEQVPEMRLDIDSLQFGQVRLTMNQARIDEKLTEIRADLADIKRLVLRGQRRD